MSSLEGLRLDKTKEVLAAAVCSDDDFLRGDHPLDRSAPMTSRYTGPAMDLANMRGIGCAR
jgi:hypothetical protein